MKQTREKLRELDKETLIDNLLLFQGRVSQLERQVRELKELTGLSGPPDLPAKAPQNSSIPSDQSRKAKKRRQSKGKRGAKAGHKGTNRRRGQTFVGNQAVLDGVAQVNQGYFFHRLAILSEKWWDFIPHPDKLL